MLRYVAGIELMKMNTGKEMELLRMKIGEMELLRMKIGEMD